MKCMSPLSQMNDLLGGLVPGQEADGLRGEPSLAPVGSSAPSLTFPLSSFSPSPLQPINPTLGIQGNPKSYLPFLLSGLGLHTLLRGLL